MKTEKYIWDWLWWLSVRFGQNGTDGFQRHHERHRLVIPGSRM
ncbi:hypothetical protein [Methylovulum miyakonense]|nr:hypothetical protein [Methylovulum miyakonense]